MRFLKVLLPVLVLGVLVLAPVTAEAANATFFGPIFPPECNCDGTDGQPKSAPDFKCVLATFQNGINFVLSMGVIIFVLVAVYAGFLLMTNPFHAENKTKARTILLNAVIGLLIALSAWLLVDFIMKSLYNEQWGPWNSILGDGGTMCIVVKEGPSGPVTTGGGAGTGGITTAPGTVSGGSCPSSTGCVDLAPEISCAASGCKVASSLKTALKNINASANWTVTEGYPASRSHRAACHGNGTCVDVAFRPTTYNETNVINFMQAARAVNLRTVFETEDCSLRDVVKRRGYAAFCREDGGGYESISGTHFSVYSQ